jgi:ribosomal protein S12 methylthiotransferase
MFRLLLFDITMIVVYTGLDKIVGGGRMRDIHVALVSLGCAKNLVDSETMLALLKEEHFTLTNNTDEAEIIIVNTCGFIDSAKEESIEKILEMASLKKGTCRLLLAAGCMAQRYGKELLTEIPELDGILGTDDVYGVSAAIHRGLAGEKVTLTAGEFPAPEGAPRLLGTPAHTAYLKIAEGCDNRCSYCAIPSIRGPYRSRRRTSVVTEAAGLVAGGVKELNLIAQDITLFGMDTTSKKELPLLLRELAGLENLHWIRLLYAYPERLDDEIIEAVAVEQKVCNYLDLPLQHGSDAILRRMGRRMKSDQILTLLEKLRRRIPGIVLRSSFIVGFPGEGEEEFEQLLTFLQEAQLDRVGFFAYSREEGTPAACFHRQVPEGVKQERVDRAVALQSSVILEKNKILVGSIQRVMIDGHSALDSSLTLARTYGQAPDVDGYVRLPGIEKKNGEMVSVRITGFEGYDLLGSLVSSS